MLPSDFATRHKDTYKYLVFSEEARSSYLPLQVRERSAGSLLRQRLVIKHMRELMYRKLPAR